MRTCRSRSRQRILLYNPVSRPFGILPVNLSVPESVTMQKEDLASGLAVLSVKLTQRNNAVKHPCRRLAVIPRIIIASECPVSRGVTEKTWNFDRRTLSNMVAPCNPSISLPGRQRAKRDGPRRRPEGDGRRPSQKCLVSELETSSVTSGVSGWKLRSKPRLLFQAWGRTLLCEQEEAPGRDNIRVFLCLHSVCTDQHSAEFYRVTRSIAAEVLRFPDHAGAL